MPCCKGSDCDTRNDLEAELITLEKENTRLQDDVARLSKEREMYHRAFNTAEDAIVLMGKECNLAADEIVARNDQIELLNALCETAENLLREAQKDIDALKEQRDMALVELETARRLQAEASERCFHYASERDRFMEQAQKEFKLCTEARDEVKRLKTKMGQASCFLVEVAK